MAPDGGGGAGNRLGEVEGRPNEQEMQSMGFTSPSLLQRSVGPMTVNGVRHSMLTLTCTALGGGVLSVSYVMRICGLALGTLLLVVGAGVAFLSTTALMRMSGATGQTTYAGLFSHCAGSVAGPVLDAMLFVFGNGSCVGYMVFLGDFIPSLLALGGTSVPEWLQRRETAIVGSTLLITPVALQRDVAVLRYVAPVSIIALVYMGLTVAVKSPFLYGEHRGKPGFGEITWVNFNAHVCDAFAICVFAFNCHLNVLPVAGNFVRPTKSRIVKVSARVNLVQMCFYSLIGVTGYLSFLDKTPGDLIEGFPVRDAAVVVGRLMLTFTMLVALAMNLSPTVRSALQIKEYFGSRRESLFDSQVGNTEEGSTCRSRVLLTLTCLVVQALIAIEVPQVADIIGLLGATIATAMIMSIPAYCMGVVMPPTLGNRLRRVALHLFSLLSLASVPVKILTWTHVID